MRVLNRAQHLLEQQHALAHAQALRVAMFDQRLPLDIGECQVGLATGRDARVVQARDVRVHERRQDVALACELLGEAAAAQPGVRKLQRDLAFQHAVGSLGQPDAAHAATADLADQRVVAHTLTGASRGFIGAELGQGGQAVVGAWFGVLGQHLPQALDVGLVRCRQPGQPGFARADVECQRFVEQPAQRGDGGGVEGHQSLSMAPRSSRALVQSRRTVRSVKSSASPISASE